MSPSSRCRVLKKKADERMCPPGRVSACRYSTSFRYLSTSAISANIKFNYANPPIHLHGEWVLMLMWCGGVVVGVGDKVLMVVWWVW